MDGLIEKISSKEKLLTLMGLLGFAALACTGDVVQPIESVPTTEPTPISTPTELPTPSETLEPLPTPDHLTQLENYGIDYSRQWQLGHQYNPEDTNSILTIKNTENFLAQSQLAVNELLGAINENEGNLHNTKSIWEVTGTNSEQEPVPVLLAFNEQGEIIAMVCPNETQEDDYQTILSPDPGNSEIAMTYKQGIIYASIQGNILIREKQGWHGIPRAIGGPEDVRDPISVENDSVSEFPLYLSVINEPAKYVAGKFGVSFDDLVRINPGLGEEVNSIDGVRLPIQPKSIEQVNLLTIRDYGILGFKAPSVKDVLDFLNERGWKPVPLTIDLIPAVLATNGSHINPCPKGWSFRQNPERHYAVVYVYNRPDQERHLWHELCHEALNSSDETVVWECTRKAGY